MDKKIVRIALRIPVLTKILKRGAEMAAEKNSIAQAMHQKPPVGANQHSAEAEQKRITKAQIQDPFPKILAKNAVTAVGVRWIKDDLSPILVAITMLADVDDMASEDLARRLYAIQKLARMGIRTADDIICMLGDERGAMQEQLAELEGGEG
jgi:hypothetical protein